MAKKVKLETLEPTLDQLKDYSTEEAAVLTFEDEPDHVRCGALEVLRKLDPSTLAQRVPALLGCLK